MGFDRCLLSDEILVRCRKVFCNAFGIGKIRLELVHEQGFGQFRAQQRVKSAVARLETIDMLVVRRQVGLVKLVHRFRQTNDSPAKVHLLNFGLVFDIAGINARAFVAGNGESDNGDD